VRRLWLVLAVCGGCYSPVGELIAPHVEAGGAIVASLDGGPELSTKALADATSDPMTVNGSSPFLVVGLVVGDDLLSGMSAKTQLLDGKAVELTVTATGRTQLSVHLNGRSCAATSGVVRLTPGDGKLDGDFAGLGEGCQLGGTVTDVPIDK
jgi:hypothetical protein